MSTRKTVSITALPSLQANLKIPVVRYLLFLYFTFSFSFCPISCLQKFVNKYMGWKNDLRWFLVLLVCVSPNGGGAVYHTMTHLLLILAVDQKYQVLSTGEIIWEWLGLGVIFVWTWQFWSHPVTMVSVISFYSLVC